MPTLALLALLLAAAPPPSRPLTTSELKGVASLLEGFTPVSVWAMEARALGSGRAAPWFVPAAKDGRLRAFLILEENVVARLAPTEPGFHSLQDVELTDFDGDGRMDLVVLARFGEDAKPRVLLLWQRDKGSFEEPVALEARLTRDLGPNPSVKKVRERMRYLLGAFGAPKPGAYALQPGCQEVPIPFAMTRDVRYAASQDNGIEVDELATDKEPSWMTSTLRSELREDVQFGCVMDQKMRAMHGRGRDCDDPLKRLNRALSTARRPMQFVPLESLFASEAEGVSFDGAVISIQRTLLGAKQPGIEVPIGAFRCGENEAPRLVGVVLGAAVAYVYVESNDPIDKPAKQAPPKDDIFSPEGTWLQDLVPEIPETRKVRVLAIKLAPT